MSDPEIPAPPSEAPPQMMQPVKMMVLTCREIGENEKDIREAIKAKVLSAKAGEFLLQCVTQAIVAGTMQAVMAENAKKEQELNKAVIEVPHGILKN